MSNEEINELLERTCVNDKHGPYFNYKGCFLNIKFEKYASEIENLQVRDTDVWLTSFPKTGTTWLQEMVYLIATDCDYESAKKPISERFPHLELNTMVDANNMPTNQSENLPKGRSNVIEYIKQMEQAPRFVKTHLPYFLLPKSIRTKETQPKVLHITRNPKDVCVSYYYHYIRSHGYRGNFNEFCTLFLADKVLFAPFWENVTSYWGRRNDMNILFLKYEDMKSDLRSIIERVATFLGKSLTEKQIEELRIHLDFESMRNNDAVNYELIYKGPIKHMRKGAVGDHKNYMDDKIGEEFDKWIANNDPGLY